MPPLVWPQPAPRVVPVVPVAPAVAPHLPLAPYVPPRPTPPPPPAPEPVDHDKTVLTDPAELFVYESDGFTIAREWRGSLLPGMVAHGLNNFVILTLNIVLLRQT